MAFKFVAADADTGASMICMPMTAAVRRTVMYRHIILYRSEGALFFLFDETAALSIIHEPCRGGKIERRAGHRGEPTTKQAGE